MASSERRVKDQQAKTARKKASQSNPGGNSIYARKLRGIYAPNSPYLTGNWGTRMKGLSVDLPPEELSRLEWLYARPAYRDSNISNSIQAYLRALFFEY